jgi:hypothetical protein
VCPFVFAVEVVSEYFLEFKPTKSTPTHVVWKAGSFTGGRSDLDAFLGPKWYITNWGATTSEVTDEHFNKSAELKYNLKTGVSSFFRVL